MGCITIRHKGGSQLKKHYIYLNNLLLYKTKSGIIISLFKPSKLTSFIGLIKYTTGSYTYILLPSQTWIGDLILSLSLFNKDLINTCFIELGFKNYKSIITYVKNLAPSSLIFNLMLHINKGGQYAKSAGTFCKIINVDFTRELILIQLPTMQRKWINWNCVAILGRTSNVFHKKEIFGKAGYYRNINVRPTVRGVAMNPVDHPHGGRTKTNSPELTPWGKIAKFNK